MRPACPYCRDEQRVECWQPTEHEVLHQCFACGGVMMVRFLVHVEGVALSVQGEKGRVAEDLEMKLKEEQSRNRPVALGASS
jgi:hypothetical protein